MGLKLRVKSTLPKDPVFIAGYEQGMADLNHAVLTFFEEKYIHGEGKPERGTPEAQYFLDGVRELAQLLREAQAGTK